MHLGCLNASKNFMRLVVDLFFIFKINLWYSMFGKNKSEIFLMKIFQHGALFNFISHCNGYS